MKPLNIFSFSNFQSKEVRDVLGHEYGTIKDVLVDPSFNRVLLVVISQGGFAGTDLGGDYVAIPWPLVRVNPNTNMCILEVDREKINKAPRIDYKELINGDQHTLEEVFSYYGYPEYWKNSHRNLENIKTLDPIRNENQEYMGSDKDTSDIPNEETKLSNDMDFDKLTGKKGK